MLPPHYLFFEAQRYAIESHPLVYLATAATYYFISLTFLSARARKIINIIFASYVSLQVLSLTLMFIGLFWDSINGTWAVK